MPHDQALDFRPLVRDEKAGFAAVGEGETPDGPALLMRVTRAEWRANAG